jgi:hypothetical protein
MTIDEAKYAIDKISQTEELIINFQDLSFIESVFNTEYRKFIAIVSKLLKLSDEEYRQVKLRLAIVDDRSPFFQFEYEKTEN